MDVRKILYALPPRITARIIAFVTALTLTVAGARVALAFTPSTSGGDEGGEQEGSLPTDTDEEGDDVIPENSVFLTEGALTVGSVINATGAVLCDLGESRIIAEKNMQGDVKMLDISIFMTAIISAKAINDGILSLTDQAVCPASAAKSEGYTLSSDVLPIGKRMKIAELIRCMVYQRGSAYAYTLAVHISGSEEAFVLEMNAEAERLGLVGTVFTSCTGDESKGGKTTAYDTAVVLKELLKFSFLRDILCSSEQLEVGYGQGSSVKLVVKNDFFESYCTESQARLDGILGGKISGDGNESWSVVVFNDGEREYLSVIIGSRSPFSDALMLFSAYALCRQE